eukprot:Polyplicarium_translucidae@DN2020_c0_g1_i2.p1
MIAIAVLLFLGRAAGGEVPDDPRVTSVRMPRHSLLRDNIASPSRDWRFFGAAVSTAKSAVLLPAVLNRTGAIWNTEPVQTNNFELEYTFRINGPQKTATDGFAFWYSLEPVPDPSHPHSPAELFGFTSTFRGLGVFVSNYDRAGKLNPSISAALGDGKTVWDIHTQVPSNDGVYFPCRNSKLEITIKVSTGPGGIVGQARLGQQSWTDCFRLPWNPAIFLPGGVIGFSARSDLTTAVGDGTEADLISILSVSMSNLDLTGAGEKDYILEGDDSPLDSADILRELGPNHDARALSEHLRQTNRFIYKITIEAKERDEQLRTTLSSWMILAVLLSITLFGIWFWKRIRDMEKKHYL